MTAELFKLLGICLIAAVLSLILKAKSGEYAFLVVIAAGAAVIAVVFRNIAQPIQEISDKISEYGIQTEYFKVALKAVGIAYITDFIADACRDSGQLSLASKAELAGKAAIFLLSVPLVMSVLETAVGFIK